MGGKHLRFSDDAMQIVMALFSLSDTEPTHVLSMNALILIEPFLQVYLL
jgi:hypothetical protein